MHNRLVPIIEHKQKEVIALYQQCQEQPDSPLAQLLNGHLCLPRRKSFKAALQTDQLGIIAEIKRQSPSKGHLATIADPIALARRYFQSGASAISILTDTPFFGGSLTDLEQVSTEFNTTTLPFLRKDFMIDKIQLAEAKLAGADAVLAIVAVLGNNTAAFINQAKGMGLDVLVEVHAAHELDIALNAGAEIIGINNRNLQTMVIDTKQSLQLVNAIPAHIVKIAESGILVPELARAYHQAGFDAVLIGEALVTANDPQIFIEACREN